MNNSVMVMLMTYNHAPYIRSALDSILNQTYEDLSVMVVDDCSTDGTTDIVKEYMPALEERFGDRLTVITMQENAGHIQAFYFATEYFKQKCGEEFVQILEGDDFLEPDSIRERMETLVKEGADAVHSDVKFLIPSQRLMSPAFWKYNSSYAIETPMTTDFLLRDNRIFTCSLLSKREFFIPAYNYGTFHELGITLCDYAACLRMLHLGAKIVYLDRSTATYRKIEGSVTNSIPHNVLVDKTNQVKTLAKEGTLFNDL